MATVTRRSGRTATEGSQTETTGVATTRATSLRRHSVQLTNDADLDAPASPQQGAMAAPVASTSAQNVTFTLDTPEPPRPRKRQRTGEANGVVPDTECSFCEGSVDRNRDGVPEEMISCTRCGSSGHFSCLHMKHPRLIDTVKSYDWVCMECKLCEECGHDDDDLLFCDRCDRGWHGHCLDQPLDKAPKGSWICPLCRRPTVDKPVRNGLKVRLAQPLPAARPSSQIRTSSNRHANGNLSDDSDADAANRTDGIATTPRNAVASSIGTAKRNSPRQRQRAADLAQKRDKGKARAYDVGVGDPAASAGPRIKLPNGFFGGASVPGAGSLRVRLRLPQPSDYSGGPQDEPDEALPYGGILVGKAAEAGDREPRKEDRRRYERAKTTTDAQLAAATANDFIAAKPLLSKSLSASVAGPSLLPVSHSMPDLSIAEGGSGYLRVRPAATPTPTGSDSMPGTPGPLPDGLFSNVRRIRFGEYEIETWYQAPYPEEYSRVADGRLWLCEFCLKYMKSSFQADRHRVKCKTRHPPGDEIYRDGNVSVFEVDGRKSKIYCQNLCLLAKMFLDHKTLYYDVDPFLFYVMTETDADGAQFVGYFSKEKRSPTNNVSCIMTLPVRQRRGWGNLLVDFSYLLSRKEGRVGTPEKPLSDLGLVTYRNYWTLAIYRCILDMPADQAITIDEISRRTSIIPEEIYYILRDRHLIHEGVSAPPTPVASTAASSPVVPAKQRRHNLPRRHPGRGGGDASDDDEIVVPHVYAIGVDRPSLTAHVANFDSKGYLVLRPEKLKWTPFLTTRGALPAPLPGKMTAEAKAIESERPPLPGTAARIEVIDDPHQPGPITVDNHGVEVAPNGHVEPRVQNGVDTNGREVTPPTMSSPRKRKEPSGGGAAGRRSPSRSPRKSVGFASASPYKRARRSATDAEQAEVADILLGTPRMVVDDDEDEDADGAEADGEGEDDDGVDSGVAF